MNQERENQIADLIKEYYDEVAPTKEEITAVEEELRKNPQTAVAELCITGITTSVNQLYMSSAVAALRKR
jgi:hypothetical protein